MNIKKSLVIGLCFATLTGCNWNNNDPQVPQPEVEPSENIYDGSITYVSTNVNPLDTGEVNSDGEQTVLALCNLNVLADEVTEVETYDYHTNRLFYRMDANVAAGQSLKVEFQTDFENTVWTIGHSLVNWAAMLFPYMPENWVMTTVSGDENQSTFTVPQAGVPSHLWIAFSPGYDVRVKIYENNSAAPVKEKLLKVKYTGENPYVYLDSTALYSQQ